jgi:hypothetical protein
MTICETQILTDIPRLISINLYLGCVDPGGGAELKILSVQIGAEFAPGNERTELLQMERPNMRITTHSSYRLRLFLLFDCNNSGPLRGLLDSVPTETATASRAVRQIIGAVDSMSTLCLALS